MKRELEIRVNGKNVYTSWGATVFGFLSCGDEYDIAVFNKKHMNKKETEFANAVKEAMDGLCDERK